MNTLDQEIRCFGEKSVRNVRIERHWRDTQEKVIDKYISIFMCMENNGVSDVSSDIHVLLTLCL